MYFGYLNRNSDEEVDVPIGPENTIDPGMDRGQPTHFYPGRRWWVFRVTVPSDWPKDKRVVWTLTARGITNQAKGWLLPEWEVDNGVIANDSARDRLLMAAGQTGEGETDFENRPPSITGSPAQVVMLPNVLTLTATAVDDGRPRPIPDPTGRREQGVRIRWIVYRGSGKVQFDPEVMSRRIYGKPATLETKVTFNVPGAYQLRAIASDGQLFSTYDVDVTVK
jgi:hypothetical protein